MATAVGLERLTGRANSCQGGDARRRTGHPQLWPWGADITLAWDNLANLAPAFASGRAGAVPGYRANCTTKRQRRGRGGRESTRLKTTHSQKTDAPLCF